MRRPARVVYLVESPYNRRDHARFGVAVLEARGFAVEVWDLTAALHPLVAAGAAPPDPIAWPGLSVFRDRGEALRALGALGEDDFAVCIVGYEPGSWDAYRALSRSQAGYCLLSATAIPNPSAKAPPRSPARLARAAFMRAPASWLGIRPPDFAIFGGERSRRVRPPLTAATEALWAHSLDYDIYLAEKDGPRGDGKTAVFLDEWVPFHPDYVRLGVAPYSTPERYYPALTAFFDRLERANGLSVVVAAHPRASYDAGAAPFGARRVEHGRTAALLREARCVIAHASTAAGFAVLFGKPVIFTTTGDLRASPEGPIINHMARTLGKKPLDLDKPGEIDWSAELAVDEKAYAEYRRLYLKKEGTPEAPLWEIVADRLSRPG